MKDSLVPKKDTICNHASSLRLGLISLRSNSGNEIRQARSALGAFEASHGYFAPVGV